ncbi:MAG: protein-glutamate O-methyltransferase CheR [Bacillota bacterium]|nr:protein-glutamate O-methyltransferase CheR [Bacillota bacterium]
MDFEVFIRKIGKFTGIDLTNYKRPQMERRINSLMRAQGFDNYLEYLAALEKNPVQLEKFLNHLTINVSEFYRNPPQWEIFKTRILPELLKTNPRLKTWSAGCATGEEPYTLAIILREHVSAPLPRILATDIDEKALAKAKAGVYQEKSISNIPKAQLVQYFSRVGETYQIKDEIKKLVNFQRHDLLKDPFDTFFDLILCRNVVIYFTEDAKELLYKRFRDALRPGGVLFTGSTEQIFQASQLGLEAMASFFYRRVS